jgi:hypothetical protein
MGEIGHVYEGLISSSSSSSSQSPKESSEEEELKTALAV